MTFSVPARLQWYSSLLKLHFCVEREHTKEDLSVLLLNLDTVPQNSTVGNLLHPCQCERFWSLGVLEFMNFLCDDSLLSSECIKFLRNVLVAAVSFSLLWRVKVDCFVFFFVSLQFICGLSLCCGTQAHLSRDEIQKVVDVYRQPDGRVRYKEFCDIMENG